MERLDKILSNLGYGTRKEVKILVKKGFVEVDNVVVRSSDIKVDPEKSTIIVDGEEVHYRKFIYLMMNKPSGVVSATFDSREETVIDILFDEHKIFQPFPVGRLDKDTVGLLLLTNDGKLNHRLISPKYHVDKVYYAEVDKSLEDKDIKAFEDGIILDDGYQTMPGRLEILESGNDGSRVYVTIQEGKFHQVKRMFEVLGKTVVFLKRISFGGIELDDNLKEGEYRELINEEIDYLFNISEKK